MNDFFERKPKVGMIVTDISHYGKYEVINVSSNEVGLRLISGRHVGIKPEGDTILPMSLFQTTFIEVSYNNTKSECFEKNTGIGETFTLKQKVTISIILAKLSQSKGFVTTTEKLLLANISKNDLKLNLEDPAMHLLANEIRPLNIKDIMKNLSDLNFQQKEYIVLLGYKMMKAKGTIDDLESLYMNKIVKELNIPIDKIKYILEKKGHKQNAINTNKHNNSGCLILAILVIISSMAYIMF